MAKKKTYAEMSREERSTGKAPVEESGGELDKDSREYHSKHGWPKETKKKAKGKQ